MSTADYIKNSIDYANEMLEANSNLSSIDEVRVNSKFFGVDSLKVDNDVVKAGYTFNNGREVGISSYYLKPSGYAEAVKARNLIKKLGFSVNPATFDKTVRDCSLKGGEHLSELIANTYLMNDVDFQSSLLNKIINVYEDLGMSNGSLNFDSFNKLLDHYLNNPDFDESLIDRMIDNYLFINREMPIEELLYNQHLAKIEELIGTVEGAPELSDIDFNIYDKDSLKNIEFSLRAYLANQLVSDLQEKFKDDFFVDPIKKSVIDYLSDKNLSELTKDDVQELFDSNGVRDLSASKSVYANIKAGFVMPAELTDRGLTIDDLILDPNPLLNCLTTNLPDRELIINALKESFSENNTIRQKLNCFTNVYRITNPLAPDFDYGDIETVLNTLLLDLSEVPEKDEASVRAVCKYGDNIKVITSGARSFIEERDLTNLPGKVVAGVLNRFSEVTEGHGNTVKQLIKEEYDKYLSSN